MSIVYAAVHYRVRTTPLLLLGRDRWLFDHMSGVVGGCFGVKGSVRIPRGVMETVYFLLLAKRI